MTVHKPGNRDLFRLEFRVRESNEPVVYAGNMLVYNVLKQHPSNPGKGRMCVCVCVCLFVCLFVF